MRLANRRQFAKAAWRGVMYYYRYGLPVWKVLPRFVLALGGSFVPGALAPWRESLRRRRICRKCPFYDDRLRTCGDGETMIEDTSRNRLVPGGCQCWLPLKTRVKSATCFLASIDREPLW